MTFLLLFYYIFNDLKYLNLKKSRLSNKKLGIVPEVTSILNFKMNNVTQFQVCIFKSKKVRGGVL